MINSSTNFAGEIAKSSRTFNIRLYNGSTDVSGSIKSAVIHLGSCGDSVFKVGAVFTSYIEVILEDMVTQLQGLELKLEVGVLVGNAFDYITLGYFTCGAPSTSEQRTSFIAQGRIGANFSRSFTPPATKTLANIASALTTQTGVTVSFASGITTTGEITADMSGITCRGALEILAGTVGGFATETASGTVLISKFSTTATKTVDGNVMRDLPTSNDYDFTITGVKVVVQDDPEVAYESGTVNYTLGNKYMTQGLFSQFASNLVGLSYKPSTIMLALGDPRLEPTDALSVTRSNQTTFAVPCMSIVHTYDGGWQTQVIAPGPEADGAILGTVGQAVQELEVEVVSAQTAAIVANNAANNALLQLAVVEDVAGTLAWIQEHGSYVATTDTTVQVGTIYFELTGGQYVPIANPDPEANPQSEGWYVLDISDSQAKYIMAHLAVTSAGLWVLPAGSFSSHEIEDANGRILVDAQGNPVISWQTDPQNADGYKVLLSNAGMVVFNGAGEAVASYGPTTTIGTIYGNNVHIGPEDVEIREGTEVLASFGADGAKFGKDTDDSTTVTDGTGLYVKYKYTNDEGEEFSVPVVVLKPRRAGDKFTIPIIANEATGNGTQKTFSSGYISGEPDGYLSIEHPEKRVFAVLLDGIRTDSYTVDVGYVEETPESSWFYIVFDTAPASGVEIQIVMYADPQEIVLYGLTPFYPDISTVLPASVFSETVFFLDHIIVKEGIEIGEDRLTAKYKAPDTVEFGTLRIPGIATATGSVYATLILDKEIDPPASVSISYTGGYIRGAGAQISGATITASVDSGGHALEILASKASSFTQYQTYMIVLTGVTIRFS